MKKNNNATSIAEAMIVMLVIIVWVTWLYNIYNKSNKLSNATKNRIEAIEIAREWIEAMKNIRDTNWIMFAWDKANCWNTYNYNSNCVWWWGTKIENNKSYIIYQNKSENFKWYLKKPNISWSYSFKNLDYRNKFRVYKENWFYNQTWSTNKTIYTREIKITNLTSTWMLVNSIVKWVDNSKSGVYTIKLQDLLTNWQK